MAQLFTRRLATAILAPSRLRQGISLRAASTTYWSATKSQKKHAKVMSFNLGIVK